MKIPRLLLILVIVAGSFSASATAATFTKIIMDGDAAPGLSGLTIVEASDSHLNNNGEVFFQTELSGAGVTTGNKHAMYVGSIGSYDLICREGDQAATLATGVLYESYSRRHWLGDDGRLTFQYNLQNTTNDTAVWLYDHGTLVPLMHEGDPAPGFPGLTVPNLNLGQERLFPTSTGKIVYKEKVAGTGVSSSNDYAVFTGTDATDLTPLVREGDPVPSGPDGALTKSFSQILARGDNTMIYGKMVQDVGGVNSYNDSIMWITDSNGDLQVALRELDEIAGAPSGTLLYNMGEMAFTENGNVLNCGVKLTGGGTTALNERAVLLGSLDSPFTIVARQGDTVTGLEAGATLGKSFGEGRLGNDGTMLLLNTLSGEGVVDTTNDSVLLIGNQEDGFHVLVREGQQAPGFEQEVLFRAAGSGQPWGGSDFTINNNGGFVLLAEIGDGEDFQSEGLFATDPVTGELELVLTIGDTIEVEPGVFKEVSDIDGTYSHTQQMFNDLDQVLFSVEFTDGTEGIFIANLNAVPEPSMIVMVVMSLASLVALRRRSA